MANKTSPNHGRAVWVLIMVISLGVSLGLNIWHAVAPPEPPAGDVTQVDGRVVLALIVGVLPVAMNSLMLHVFPKSDVPAAVKWIVAGLFLVALYMSMSAVYEMLAPVTGDKARTFGMVAIIDVPALVSLYMLARKPVAKDVAIGQAPVATEMAKPVGHVAIGQTPVAKPVATPMAKAKESVAKMEATVATVEGHLATARMATELAKPVATPMANGQKEAKATGGQSVAKPVGQEVATPPAPAKKPVAKAVPAQSPSSDGMATKDLARLTLLANPGITVDELAVAIGKAPRTARRYLEAFNREMAMANPVADGQPATMATSDGQMANHVAKSVGHMATEEVANP